MSDSQTDRQTTKKCDSDCLKFKVQAQSRNSHYCHYQCIQVKQLGSLVTSVKHKIWMPKTQNHCIAAPDLILVQVAFSPKSVTFNFFPKKGNPIVSESGESEVWIGNVFFLETTRILVKFVFIRAKSDHFEVEVWLTF